MTEPEKDQVTSSTPQDVAADVAATASADDARAAEVVADAEVIEANEAGELDAELEQAAAEAVASAIEESEELAAAAEAVRQDYFGSFLSEQVASAQLSTSADYDKLDPQALYEAIQAGQAAQES